MTEASLALAMMALGASILFIVALVVMALLTHHGRRRAAIIACALPLGLVSLRRFSGVMEIAVVRPVLRPGKAGSAIRLHVSTASFGGVSHASSLGVAKGRNLGRRKLPEIT